MRSIDAEEVAAYLAGLRSAADQDGALVIDNPRSEQDRIRLGIAERAGACAVEPAPGGRLAVTLRGALDRAAAERECSVARDRGWRAYRAVKEFAWADACRRRMLLDHFGDPTPGAPVGRCCDVCDREAGSPIPSRCRCARRSRGAPRRVAR